MIDKIEVTFCRVCFSEIFQDEMECPGCEKITPKETVEFEDEDEYFRWLNKNRGDFDVF